MKGEIKWLWEGTYSSKIRFFQNKRKPYEKTYQRYKKNIQPRITDVLMMGEQSKKEIKIGVDNKNIRKLMWIKEAEIHYYFKRSRLQIFKQEEGDVFEEKHIGNLHD